jgi:hypothetical protein
MTLLLFSVLKVGYSEWIFIGFTLPLLGWYYKLVKEQFPQKKKNKQKRWLFEEVITYGVLLNHYFSVSHVRSNLIIQMIF